MIYIGNITDELPIWIQYSFPLPFIIIETFNNTEGDKFNVSIFKALLNIFQISPRIITRASAATPWVVMLDGSCSHYVWMMTEVCGHDTETDRLHIVSKWEITMLEKANNISFFTKAFKNKQTVVHVRL